MKKAFITIVLLIALCAGGWFGWHWYNDSEASNVTLREAKITDVAPMIRLCSVEIYDEVPVKGQIGNRHIFARMALNGSISFDLDSIVLTETSDTIQLILPKEIVTIYESTDKDSYQVIDVWCDSFFGSSNFTTAEENKIKARVRDNYRADIYRKGYVERARKEAAENLTSLLKGLTGKTVIVEDPTPQGTFSKS